MVCTVTWVFRPDGYDLLMNRDELHTRGEGIAPRVHDQGAIDPVRFLAPIDRDGGGTWIAANELGITVCLLNHYPASPPAEDRSYESRGRLVMRLAVAHGVREVDQAMDEIELASYRPFTLLVAEPGRTPHLRRWNGFGAIEHDDRPDPPITSSSYDQDAVVAARRATYAGMAGNDPTPEQLLAYHSSHHPEPGPYSVCAHREDGGTKSLCRVVIGPDAVTMHYLPGPPCERADSAVRMLPRRPL